MIRVLLFFSLIILGCSQSKLEKDQMSTETVNSILGQVSENDSAFTEKGIAFDSIITLAGVRLLENKSERIKVKLFFFGDNCRGYFNLIDKDSKNLQFFGSKIDNKWALKCVTKLNMEEVGGYIIFWPSDKDIKGVWSNGDVNFKQGKIILTKQELDYNILTVW